MIGVRPNYFFVHAKHAKNAGIFPSVTASEKRNVRFLFLLFVRLTTETVQ